MPSSDATRRASSTALSEQQPPCFADSSMSSRGHCCRVTPTTSWPWACKRAAATEESTPPDIATATFIEGNLPSRHPSLPWGQHRVRIRRPGGDLGDELQKHRAIGACEKAAKRHKAEAEQQEDQHNRRGLRLAAQHRPKAGDEDDQSEPKRDERSHEIMASPRDCHLRAVRARPQRYVGKRLKSVVQPHTALPQDHPVRA